MKSNLATYHHDSGDLIHEWTFEVVFPHFMAAFKHIAWRSSTFHNSREWLTNDTIK